MNTRMCVVCRKKTTKDNLLRCIKHNGDYIVEQKKDLPARGFYICKCDECIESLNNKKIANKIFRGNITEEKIQKLYRELEIAKSKN